MNPILKLEGIYTPLIIPFNADGSFHHDALGQLIEHLLGCSVHGLISGAAIGQGYALPITERLALAKFTHQCADRQPPVLIGTGSMSTSDSILLTQSAADIGADGIMLTSPPCIAPTERENPLNALAIDKAARAEH